MWRVKILMAMVCLFLFCSFADAEIKKHIYVDGKSRTAIIFSDEKGNLHIQYFTDGSMQFLGEEIFKEGQKIMDSYRENDGLKD